MNSTELGAFVPQKSWRSCSNCPLVKYNELSGLVAILLK